MKLLSLLLSFLFSGSLLASDEILVGEVGTLSGGEAMIGIQNQRGLKIATEEINARGGVRGKKIRIITLDDQGKPDEAATAITRLIERDKVVAIVGEVVSSRSLAMAPIAQSKQVPMISSASTNPKVTLVGDYIFRVCFIDTFQGPVMAKFIYNNLKIRNVAVLKDLKSDYSVGLSEFFSKTFEKLGGKVVAVQTYSSGDFDFKAQLTALKEVKPEMIYLPGYYSDIGLILRQARELGLQAIFSGGDGWDMEKVIEIGGANVNGSYFSAHYSTDNPSPLIQKYVATYRRHFKAEPDAVSALAYDAGMILFQALEKAKSLSGPDIKEALRKTEKFNGVTGRISFNATRDAVKPALIMKIENEKKKFVTTLEP